MDFNFELILAVLTILSGFIWLVDALLFAPARKRQGKTTEPVMTEYARSFFPILLIVLLLRSFLFEPFKIPSGSDEPTLLVGDFIIANKFIYGLRLPVLHTKILPLNEPKIGDIILFRWPVDPSVNFIKRLIGGPGDHISYQNKVLYINGKEAPQKYLGTGIDQDEGDQTWPVQIFEEDLNGVKHKIYVRQDVPAQDFSLIVPAGQYFAMGDNRDNSNDSRYWGFVPEQNLVGKAFAIWLSWQWPHWADFRDFKVRWYRMGTLIQ